MKTKSKWKYDYRKFSKPTIGTSAPDCGHFTGEQMAVVDWNKNASPGNIAIVDSTAGSGKTTVNARAMFEDTLNACLYVTFAKRNVLDMDKKPCPANWIKKTFCATGNLVLQKAWGRIHWDYEADKKQLLQVCFDIQTEAQAMFMARKLMAEAQNLCVEFPTHEELMKLAHERDCLCDEKREALGWTVEKIAQVVLGALKLSLVRPADGGVTFGGMTAIPVWAGLARPMFGRVFADEFQDASPINKKLLTMITDEKSIIMATGDDNQGIYAFRGALYDAMKKYKAETGGHLLKMSYTFRNGKNIVSKVNELVPDHYAHEGNQMGIVTMDKPWEKMIAEATPGKDAILSRTNAPLVKPCLGFIVSGKPANIEGKDIGKGLIALVKEIGGNDCGEFVTRLETWSAIKASKVGTGWNAGAKLDKINDDTECLKALADVCGTPNEIIGRINGLFTDAEERRTPCIVLSTVHKAKGLEWDRVSILSSTFQARATMSDEEAQQERNVKFVAWTRPMSSLSFVNDKQ